MMDEAWRPDCSQIHLDNYRAHVRVWLIDFQKVHQVFMTAM